MSMPYEATLPLFRKRSNLSEASDYLSNSWGYELDSSGKQARSEKQ